MDEKYIRHLEKRVAELNTQRDLADERRKAAMEITEDWRDKHNKLLKKYNDLLKNEAIDNKIETWHNGNDNITLSEYLGMTEREYAVFVESSKLPQLAGESPRPTNKQPEIGEEKND